MTEPKKRKNLIDHIREAHENSINFSKSFDLSKSQEQHLSTPETEQMDDSTSQQLNNSTSQQLPRQLNNSTSQQLPRQLDNSASQQLNKPASQQVSNSTSQQLDKSATRQLDPLLKPADLKFNQYRILFEIYFKRPFKVHGPERIGKTKNYEIAYGTVRTALNSLVKKEYIYKPFSINNGVVYGTTCLVNELKCFPLFGPSPVINSQQVSNSTSQQLDKSASQQVNNSTSQQLDKSATQQPDTSYNIDRQIYININNLSIYLENSKFWKGQGLTLIKCEQWMKEMQDCTPEFLLIQLQFGEEAETVIKADKPLSYFRSCLMAGGLERPKGFEFPAERIARIKQLDHEARKVLKQKEKEIADEDAFLDALKNKEAVDDMVTKIESRFTSTTMKALIKKYKQTGEIDSRLENALRTEFFREEKPE